MAPVANSAAAGHHGAAAAASAPPPPSRGVSFRNLLALAGSDANKWNTQWFSKNGGIADRHDSAAAATAPKSPPQASLNARSALRPPRFDKAPSNNVIPPLDAARLRADLERTYQVALKGVPPELAADFHRFLLTYSLFLSLQLAS